jgi:hypothetical protein
MPVSPASCEPFSTTIELLEKYIESSGCFLNQSKTKKQIVDIDSPKQLEKHLFISLLNLSDIIKNNSRSFRQELIRQYYH